MTNNKAESGRPDAAAAAARAEPLDESAYTLAGLVPIAGMNVAAKMMGAYGTLASHWESVIKAINRLQHHDGDGLTERLALYRAIEGWNEAAAHMVASATWQSVGYCLDLPRALAREAAERGDEL